MKKNPKKGPRVAEAKREPADATPVLLRCRQCGAALTGVLRVWPDPRPLTLLDGSDALPQGFFWRAPEGADFWQGAGPSLVVTNRHDLVGLKPSGDRSGCCGPSGMDGPNLSCPAGHPVAIEVSDCWTPHMALFGSQAALCSAAGLEGPDARVFNVGGAEPLRSKEAFVAWAHGALDAAEWHGDDVRALVEAWLKRTGEGETACIVWLNAETSRQAGVPLGAIEAAVTGAQEGSPRRRLFLVFA